MMARPPTSSERGVVTPLVRMLLLLVLCQACVWAGEIERGADGRTIIHVTVHNLPDPSRTDTFNRAELAGVKAFKERFPQIFAEKYRDKYKAHPEIYGDYDWDRVEVRLRRFSGIRVGDGDSDLLAIAGGMAPDVLYVNFRRSDNYIRNAFLYPLDEYYARLSQEDKDFRIHPKLWPVIERRGPDGAKHKYAMPYGGALGKVLLFRKDLFDEFGVPWPTADWTWEDLIAAARKMTAPDRGIYGCRFGRGKRESWYWITFLWSAGGEVMTYNEERDEWRCVFDSHEAAVALEFYTRICGERWTDENGKLRRGYAIKDAAEASVKWERGEIAMMFDYIDERVFANINTEVTGMVPVPLGPVLSPELQEELAPQGLLWDGRTRGGELNSRMMGLFSQIEEPAVRDAAWEFMLFYDGPESVQLKTKIMVEGGLGQFVNPRYLRQFGYPEIERLAPRGWSDVFETAIATGKPEPYGRNSNFAYELMTLPMNRAEEMILADQLPDNYDERVAVMQTLLEDACTFANEEMIGVVSPAERLKRRITAWIVLAGLVTAFSFVFRRIMRVFSPPAVAGDTGPSWAFRKYAWAYILILPALASIFLWSYLPLLRGSWMAFFDYRLIGDSTWVGVDNFGDILYNSAWWQSVWNALRYATLVIALTFLPPIILAIFLQEIPRCKLLFRIIYYLPAVITGLVTVLLWKQFFEPSERGALNSILMRVPAIGFILVGLILLAIAVAFARRLFLYRLYPAAVGFLFVGVILLVTCSWLAVPILLHQGETWASALPHLTSRLFITLAEPYRWLGDPDTAMIACVIPMVWAGVGPGCLIYLAALKGIPDDYYEAADIDGASFIDKLLFIVFPNIKALIIINFVGVFIRSWYEATGNVLVLTGGGAGTETAGLHIWFKAFTFLKLGPATAMAWMLGFMLIGFTVHQLSILSRVEFRAAGGKK